MKEITYEFLMSEALPRVFQRGVALYEEGEVLGIIVDNNEISAEVFGSWKYDVQIKLNSRKEWEFHCSCPYDGEGICKHSVALGLAVINGEVDIDLTMTEQNPKTDKDSEEKIFDLIEKADSREKDEFLKRILQSNSDFVTQFEVFLKGELNCQPEIDMDEMVETFLAELKTLDLSHRNLMNLAVYDDSDYYKEEWEVLYDAVKTQIYNRLAPFIEEIPIYLRTGKNFEAFKIVLALYEALVHFEIKEMAFEIPNEDEVVYCIEDEIKEIWDEQLDLIKDSMIKKKDEQPFVESVLNLLNDRLTNPEIEDDVSIQFFHPILIEYATPENETFFNNTLFQTFDESFFIKEKLKILYEKKEMQKWLIMAEKYSKTWSNVMDLLLTYHAENKNKNEFITHAKIAFANWNGEFAELIFPNIEFEDDNQLYLDVVKSLVIKKLSMKYFKMYEKLASSEQIESLINTVKQLWYSSKFYINILEHRKEFELIKQFFSEHIREPEIEYFTIPIINIYPVFCFKKIRDWTEPYLKYNKSRKFYEQAAGKMKLLLMIKDEKVQRNIQAWFNSIYEMYNRRPALKDELQMVGIEQKAVVVEMIKRG